MPTANPMISAHSLNSRLVRHACSIALTAGAGLIFAGCSDDPDTSAQAVTAMAGAAGTGGTSSAGATATSNAGSAAGGATAVAGTGAIATSNAGTTATAGATGSPNTNGGAATTSAQAGTSGAITVGDGAAGAAGDSSAGSTGLAGAASGGAAGSGASNVDGTAGDAGAAGEANDGDSGGASSTAGAGAGDDSESGGASAASSAGAGSDGMAGESATGGADNNDMGGVFEVTSDSWNSVVNNDDCTASTQDLCPVFPEEQTNLESGSNISPELTWTGVPAGTQSFALALWDLSNEGTHWMLWNVPGDLTGLPGGLDGNDSLEDVEGAEQSTNFGQRGYFGSGKCGNVYEFRLYALSTPSIDAPTLIAENSGANDQETLRLYLDDAEETLGTAFVRLQSRDYCQQ